MEDSTEHILCARLREIDALLEELTKERGEIDSALKVVARYAKATTSSVTDDAVVSSSGAQDTATGAPRPDGIPTIWDMTQDLFVGRKVKTATVADITDHIRRKWWPGVATSQIGPTIHRIASEGRLTKVGKGVFALPDKENEPPKGGSEAGEADTPPDPAQSPGFQYRLTAADPAPHNGGEGGA